MRLDHLLSKEHLQAKACKEPAPPECGGGVLNGGDTGEGPADNGPGIEYSRPRERLEWKWFWYAVRGDRIGTLLGPETISAVTWLVGFRRDLHRFKDHDM
ncbi:hypothetical protein GCM10020218_090320 [Dactylosporangium vinaceum]